MDLGGGGAKGRVSPLDAGPGRSRFIGLEGRRVGQGLWRSNLPLVVSRPKQEPHPAMVRHEDMRKPDEGTASPGAPQGKRTPLPRRGPPAGSVVNLDFRRSTPYAPPLPPMFL